MKKTFIEAEIRSLIGQWDRAEISFSRMVAIMNEKAEKGAINPLDNNLQWLDWLEKSPSNGLNETMQSDAIRDIYAKVNEICNFLENERLIR